MKTLLFASLLLLVILGCKKNCTTDQIATCQEVPVTSVLCDCTRKGWFYDGTSNSCELILYGGCSLSGFETEQQCEECLCK